MRCASCGSEMSVGLFAWHWICNACRFECSTLSPQINQLDGVDEFEREAALRPIRDNNFDLLLGWLMGEVVPAKVEGPKKALLDVGCAHGWFLEKAREYYDVLGLEPDNFVASRTKQRGLPVREGYFPELLVLMKDSISSFLMMCSNIFRMWRQSSRNAKSVLKMEAL